MTAPTEDAPPIAVRYLDHVAIKTPRLAESRDFYVQVIGLTVGPRPAFDFAGLWLYAGQDDVVHLVETDGDKAGSAASGLNPFTLRIADFDAADATLRAMGEPFETEVTPGGALRRIYVTDPNGVRVELNAPGA